MSLDELRKKIDTVDDQMVQLFQERMKVAAEIAQYKAEQGLPVLQPAREREKLQDVAEKSAEDMQSYTRVLYSLLFELSRAYQGRIISQDNPLYQSITKALDNTDKMLPAAPSVICQGAEGAYSQLAAEKLFKDPKIMYVNTFEHVFTAIEKGLCRYGVLPIENSSAGSVKQVYDQMVRRNFHIVRSVRIRVSHNLLAKKGIKLEEVKEIYSHEQAIRQCGKFLSELKGVKVIPCENTAVAAQMVAQSERRDVAALASASCAELYGLNCLAPAVQDEGNNHTRFICIAKNLEIYPGADKTTLMMILPHKPGSLYKALARMYALGINLLKLESRPLPERDFEFMFYFDLETSVYSEEFKQLMCELEYICEEFHYLGSYLEVV